MGESENSLLFGCRWRPDSWILGAISFGVRIPFIKMPFQSRPVLLCYLVLRWEWFPKKDDDEDDDEEIPMEGKCFISAIFVIPKILGRFSLIVNLKGLNTFVDHFNFKMEGMSVMKEMVRKGRFFLRKLTFKFQTSQIIGSTFNFYRSGRYSSFSAYVLDFHPPLGPSILF